MAENPGDAALAARLAELYRDHPQHVGIDDAPSKADEIIDRLVQSAPDSDEALIARYEYRRRYQQGENARRDLESVLARHPDNVEALWLLATAEIETGGDTNLSSAEENLNKFIKLVPTDPRGPITLARLWNVKKEPQRTVDVLMKAREQAGANGLEVDGLLASTLIDLNRLDKAEIALKDFDDRMRERLPELTTASHITLENASRLLHARLDMGRNNIDQAVRELSAIVASVGEADIAAGATEQLQAHALLAVAMAKLGRLDLAASQWKTVADQSPNLNEARLNAAAAYLQLGRPAVAIGQLETYLQRPSANPDGWILLVQSHLQQQLHLSPSERNWSEFLRVLEQAKKKDPGRWEPQLAEVLYWQALGTDESKQSAMQQLQKLEETHPNASELLGRIALCYQQLGAPAAANRAVEHYEKSESNIARRVLLRSALLSQQGQADAASKLLASVGNEVSDPERRELQLARIRLLVASGKLEVAQQGATALIAELPHQPAPLLLGIDIALMRQDFPSAEKWENELKIIGSGDGFDWQFCRARRLLEQYAKLDPATRSELDSLLDGLRSSRPDWYPIAALTARYADLVGNRRQAIDAYGLSISLGDRRPETFERLVADLYAEGRYRDADAYLSRLSADQPADGNIDSLAIALAVKENRLSAALEMAKRAVKQGSNDPMHHVWLANLLSLNNQPKEAEDVFRDSIQQFPKDPRVWNALFTYLVRTKQPERARRALEQWSEKTADGDPAKEFILAQGYEQLGDNAAAQQHYRATIAGDSKNIEARIRLGKMLLSSDVSAARGEFEEVLKVDAENAEARRYLASLLAVSGTEDDWNHAMRLLDGGKPSGVVDASGADDRLRAILLSRRGRSRLEQKKNYEAACQILTARLTQADTAGVDLDRMLLAGIYEKEAAIDDSSKSWDSVLAARDTLRPLVDRDDPPKEYLVAYIQLLLHQLERDRKQPDKSRENEERRKLLISDLALRIDELDSALGANPTTESRSVAVAFRVRLLVVQDHADEARKILDEFAHGALATTTKDTDRAKLLLQLGNLASEAGFYQEAEGWYRALLEIAPNSYVLLARSLSDQKKYSDAVDLCLHVAPKRPAGEIATLLTQLLTTAGNNKELEARVEPTITAALGKDRDNVELLMSVAVRNVSADKYEEAIKLFRRVLELQPNNTLALNNLATLLAERPNELVEARKCVEKAMAISGRSPPLLDTLGTIEIRSGKPEQAVADLEEAVAGAATDPRYYFHLAVAYQRSGRAPEAQSALDTAEKQGLSHALLTAADNALLASLKQSQPTVAGEQK